MGELVHTGEVVVGEVFVTAAFWAQGLEPRRYARRALARGMRRAGAEGPLWFVLEVKGDGIKVICLGGAPEAAEYARRRRALPDPTRPARAAQARRA